MSQTIEDILNDKGADIYSVTPESSVFDAIRKMAELGIGALLVTEGGRPVGMLSERDYARKVILQGRASRETRVAEIMSSPLITIGREAKASDGLNLMTEKRIRHLPVIEGEQLIGVVSIGDLVNAVMADQKLLIEGFERYVYG
ncbi:MAG: CBS domain-containing protein [Pseudomonadota bacterium]